MKVKVALFGREKFIERVNNYIEKQDDVEIFPFAFEHAKETELLIEKAVMCDVYLFDGPLSYFHAKEKIDKKRLPAIHLSFDEYMILTSFYHVRNREYQELQNLSIDIFNAKHVDEVLEDIKLAGKDIYSYSYGEDESIDVDKVVQFHADHFHTKKSEYALTTIEEVSAELEKKGIPHTCMQIPMLNIKKGIEKAKSIATLNKSKSAQIVAGYVRIKNIEAIKADKGEFQAQELLLKLHQILLKYSQKTYASVLANGNDQFVLFGTKGILDHITNNYRDFPLLKEMEVALNTYVDIGFGLGLTAKQAEDNAKLAVETCERSDEGACYIVNERRDMIGPLGVQKEFNPSELYQSLIHQAKLNNELSYNFIDFIEIRNNEPFSSNDIANYYRVTKRSAERTIKKLLAGDVIKIVGEEKPYVKGRPRKLFQLNQ